MHRQLARLRYEERASDANKVAVIEQVEKLPAFFDGSGVVVMNAFDLGLANINLQARNAVREMHERGLAHHARRRRNASTDTNIYILQLFVRALKHFRRGSLAFCNLRLVSFELLDQC